MLSAIGMEELVVTMMLQDGMIIVLFVHVLTQLKVQLLKVQPPKVQPLLVQQQVHPHLETVVR